ncbi:MAG: hypothetical protein WAV54_12205 [Acidimicrobiales bacterium]
MTEVKLPHEPAHRLELVVELGRDLLYVHVEKVRARLDLTLGERAQARERSGAVGLGPW